MWINQGRAGVLKSYNTTQKARLVLLTLSLIVAYNDFTQISKVIKILVFQKCRICLDFEILSLNELIRNSRDEKKTLAALHYSYMGSYLRRSAHKIIHQFTISLYSTWYEKEKKIKLKGLSVLFKTGNKYNLKWKNPQEFREIHNTEKMSPVNPWFST